MNLETDISLALVRIEEAHFLGSDSDKISEARARLRAALQEIAEAEKAKAEPPTE